MPWGSGCEEMDKLAALSSLLFALCVQLEQIAGALLMLLILRHMYISSTR
jgi:hypothetical protein